MYVYTDNGVEIELVEPPLGRGGEGSVYRMKGFDRRVAKIYTKDAAARRPKIEAMCSVSETIAADPRLERVAWPLGALYLDPERRQFAGFGMRRIDAACSMSDMEEYPPPPKCTATLAEKIDALVELAEITQALHDHGQTLGDLNDDNIVRCDDGHVGIVDADSFHARVNGTVYPCMVCMPGFVAPEVLRTCKGNDFASGGPNIFNECTDDFSLAVHIFRTLMNGAHPYHCVARRVGNQSAPAPVSIDKRVMRGESAFFGTAPNCDAPKFAPRPDIFPTDVQRAFRQAFVDGGKNPDARPTAERWARILKDYRRQLTRCSHNHGHWYLESLASCPYCSAETAATKPLASASAATSAAKPVSNKTAQPVATNAAATKPAPAKKAASTTSLAPTGTMNPFYWWLASLVGTFCTWFALVMGATGIPFLSSLEWLTPYVSTVSGTPIFPVCMLAAAALYCYNNRTDHTYRTMAKSIGVSLMGLPVGFAVNTVNGFLVENGTDLLEVVGVILAIALILVVGYWVLTHLDTVITIAVVLIVLRFLWYLFFE
jgi:DNA-binding helix-hairpin-helix protein with protein kinase domain